MSWLVIFYDSMFRKNNQATKRIRLDQATITVKLRTRTSHIPEFPVPFFTLSISVTKDDFSRSKKKLTGQICSRQVPEKIVESESF